MPTFPADKQISILDILSFDQVVVMTVTFITEKAIRLFQIKKEIDLFIFLGKSFDEIN
ncbi:hypothetical protein SAMN05216514_10738 [Kandleria vitulina]|uniref:hypothetical protein n=1 Tax=Kandleria vitulina TaxID=1630 RepID=UPI0008C47FC2|nr:hypothetical protein [Kandleria vitulina]SEI97675.1 hypothetical protein SAMN05216514_10738 [Kandleria vitulina]